MKIKIAYLSRTLLYKQFKYHIIVKKQGEYDNAAILKKGMRTYLSARAVYYTLLLPLYEKPHVALLYSSWLNLKGLNLREWTI